MIKCGYLCIQQNAFLQLIVLIMIPIMLVWMTILSSLQFLYDFWSTSLFCIILLTTLICTRADTQVPSHAASSFSTVQLDMYLVIQGENSENIWLDAG